MTHANQVFKRPGSSDRAKKMMMGKTYLNLLILIGLLSMASLTSQAQRDYYHRLFEAVHQKNSITAAQKYWGVYHKNRSIDPDSISFSWGHNYVPEAYVIMGNKFGNKVYFDHALTIMARFLAQRDDKLGISDDYNSAPANMVCSSKPQPHNRKEAWWSREFHSDWNSTDSYPFCGSYANSMDRTFGHAGESGLHIFPMALFVYRILDNPSYHNITYTQDTGSVYQNNFTNDWAGKTYYDIAKNFLLPEIEATVSAHDLYQWITWSDNGIDQGTYIFEHWVYPGATNLNSMPCVTHNPGSAAKAEKTYQMPLNYHASIGRVMVLLWKSHQLLGTSSAATYQDKAERMVNYQMERTDNHPDGGYYWMYQDETFSTAVKRCTKPDDDGHLALTVELPYWAHKLALPKTGGGNAVTSNDMSKLAKGIDRMYKQPQKFYQYVNGNSGTPSYNDGLLVIPGQHEYRPHAAVCEYSEFEQNIYHRALEATSDYFLTASDYVVNGTGGMDVNSIGFKVLAELVAKTTSETSHDFQFRPIAVKRGWGNGSFWAGIAGGDLDGDGEETHFAASRNANNRETVLYEYQEGLEVNYSTGPIMPNKRNMEQLHVENNHISNSEHYAGVAVGNITNNSPGDEVIWIRNTNGGSQTHFKTFTSDGTYLANHKSYTGFGSASEWVGLCAGDYDNNGLDDIMTVRNSDGLIVLRRDNGGANLEYLPGATHYTFITDWAAITCGDINGDNHAEMVLVRRNGDIHVYKYLSGNTVPGTVNNNVYVPSGHEVIVATLGDFDGDNKEDELVILTNQGRFEVVELSVEGIDPFTPSHSWNSQLLQLEKFDASIVLNGAQLGTINLPIPNSNCAMDHLLFARNCQSDGHFFIYDIGLQVEASLECYVLEDDGGDGDYTPGKTSLDLNDQHEHAREDFSLRVFPNPSTDRLTIQANQEWGRFSLKLLDHQGRTVFERNSDESGQEIQLDLSELSEGIYLLTVLRDGQSAVLRVVKR